LVAEDGKRGSCIEVAEDGRREGVRGETFFDSNAAGVVGAETVRVRNAEAVAEGSWTERRERLAAREIGVKDESGGARIV
jgi:hypothetical protein